MTCQLAGIKPQHVTLHDPESHAQLPLYPNVWDKLTHDETEHPSVSHSENHLT
jgi:hypothetical protein